MNPPLQPASGRINFPDTAWTRVLQGRGGDPEAVERALEDLCRQYWPAIYSYIRALGLAKEEAEDAAQDFVAEFILGRALHRVNPEAGRLRSYMKQSIRNFLASRARDAASIKRGGGVQHADLDSLLEQPATDAPPDASYDREWAWAIMERSMAVLKEGYHSRGKAALFDLIKPALAGTENLPPYALLSQSTGVSESQIKLEVHRARRRLADTLRREVAATVAAEADVEEELRYLLKALACE